MIITRVCTDCGCFSNELAIESSMHLRFSSQVDHRPQRSSISLGRPHADVESANVRGMQHLHLHLHRLHRLHRPMEPPSEEVDSQSHLRGLASPRIDAAEHPLDTV